MLSYQKSTVLVRAKGFGRLPELVEGRVGEWRLAEIFEKEGLPVGLRDAPRMPMPLGAMMGLFARSAAILDHRLLGIEVGEGMTHVGYGLWSEYCASAPRLGEALSRLVATSWAHQSGARLELVADGEHRILRFATPAFGVDKMQHCDHLLPPMLAFVRLYLGRSWVPDWVQVEYARDGEAQLVEDRLQTPMRCGLLGSGIAIKACDLTRERGVASSSRVVTLRDVMADVILADAPEPARALSAVVALRLLDGHSDIEGAARLLDLSVQGLQRRLREAGYTYREVADEARRARAIRLLVETPMTILEVGLALGYETHASFTRAFIRWMGCTPSEFRRGRGGRHVS